MRILLGTDSTVHSFHLIQGSKLYTTQDVFQRCKSVSRRLSCQRKLQNNSWFSTLSITFFIKHKWKFGLCLINNVLVTHYIFADRKCRATMGASCSTKQSALLYQVSYRPLLFITHFIVILTSTVCILFAFVSSLVYVESTLYKHKVKVITKSLIKM